MPHATSCDLSVGTLHSIEFGVVGRARVHDWVVDHQEGRQLVANVKGCRRILPNGNFKFSCTHCRTTFDNDMVHLIGHGIKGLGSSVDSVAFWAKVGRFCSDARHVPAAGGLNENVVREVASGEASRYSHGVTSSLERVWIRGTAAFCVS